MRQAKQRDKVIFSLAALAGVQIVLFGLSLRPQAGLQLPWPQTDDTLPEIWIRRLSGDDILLPSGDPTVLLVFHSTCRLCEEVAPLWQAWMTESGQGRNVLAVSIEPLGPAIAFARNHRWDVEVGVVEGTVRRSRARPFLSRTPWVFFVNGKGVILAEGHGNRLEEIMSQASPDSNEVPD